MKNLHHTELRSRDGIPHRANPEMKLWMVTIQKEEHGLDTNPKDMGAVVGESAGRGAHRAHQ